ncbi:substrate-binding periplasmic protein [Pigmentibacter ruber]|uniref:substrate-binding periplasmic protein n=1 Tax=Pigmentibacter ruber TaxID=2683196 RepID=UPI00131C0F37|nr:transporter substrate-binding domain-containing protein [Pigmentibacter ruber]BFD32935.1 hypothetical protein GTC16762_25530 [Pigmentibacter ruber]
MKNIFFICFIVFITPAFCQEKITIKFAINEDSIPLSYSINKKPKGILVDIINEFSKLNKEKYKIFLEPFPWPRVIYMVKKGEFDAFISLKSKERDEYVDYSSYLVLKENLYFYYSKENKKLTNLNTYNSINDFKNFLFLDYFGDSLNKYHSEENGFKNEFSTNKKYILFKLNKNRGDLFLSTKRSPQFLIKKYKLKNIVWKKVDFIKGDFNYYLCLRKNIANKKSILTDFDNFIKAPETIQKINKITERYIKNIDE